MSAKTEWREGAYDPDWASGSPQKRGFKALMDTTCDYLLGSEAEDMDVEQANSESAAKSSSSEAAPVEDMMGTRSKSNPEAKPDCTEEPPVQDSASAAADQPAVKLTPDEALMRLERIAIGGTGPPEVSGDPIDGLKATHEVIKVVCTVSHNFFVQRKKELRWVTETAQLARYEGIAYVLAEVLGAGNLLLKEAESMGKRALKRIEGKAGVKGKTDK